MRILELHCDYVKYTPREKAFKQAEEIPAADKGKETTLKNTLVIFATVEEGDDAATAANAATVVEKNYREVKAENILVYPYAHLSSRLAPPQAALNTLKQLAENIAKFAPAHRSPFGWYKAFELKCKGHPLAELSKTISNQATEVNIIPGDAMREYATLQGEKLAAAKEGKERDKCQRTGALIIAQAAHATLNAKLADVTLTQDGFYCDFESKPLSPATVEEVANECRAIIAAGEKITAGKRTHEAIAENAYAQATLSKAPHAKLASTPRFCALMPGSTLENTGAVNAVLITKFGGSCLNNKEGNTPLQRVYCIAFKTTREKEDYEKLAAEAEKRDHRKLGQQLDLFSLHEESPGNVFYHPKGMALRNALEKYWREEHEREGYEEIRTPIILNDELWRRSGHYDHYRENMYFTSIDGRPNAVKPMNCPGGILIYNNRQRSYRELPLRLAELGLVHRHELSGVLSGLFRVRSFTQDDAHIYCTEAQIDSEVKRLITLFKRVYEKFGFKFDVELSTRPEKAMGSQELWAKAEAALEKALKHSGLAYQINAGDGAFYGPKIDFKLNDAIGRKWQCGTIQLDFQMPERFAIEYVDSDGSKKRPVMLHRVVYGSLERFLGVLIEHYAGAFPIWLSPVQTAVIPMTEAHNEYAAKVHSQLRQAGVRSELMDSRGTMESKVRDAQMQKIPFTLVVGGEEERHGTVSVRHRDGKLERGVKTQEFCERIVRTNRERDA